MIPRARWQKIQSLFEEVVDSGPEERVARLASSCQGDSDLRHSVEAAAQSWMQNGVVQHLDGNGLLVLRVVALAAIHGTHAALPENGHDAIRAYASAEQTVLVFLEKGFGRRTDGINQRILGPQVGRQQRFHRIT